MSGHKGIPIFGERAELQQYICNKIDMLRNDFKIRLTDTDILHFRDLTSYSDVDNFAHDILINRL